MSHGLLLLFFYRFRQLILWQLAAALVGFLLFWLLFSVIPEQLGLSLKTVSSLRTSSSGRFELWQGVLGVFAQAPWLGVGPMHLAADWSLTFPSPHQALLQFLSEWALLCNDGHQSSQQHSLHQQSLIFNGSNPYGFGGFLPFWLLSPAYLF